MKWLPAVAVALSLAAIAVVLMFATVSWWPVVVGGYCAGMASGVVFSANAVSRDRATRALVCTAYASDADVLGLSHLSTVLPTPDVLEARSDALRREEVRLATRYANGDASDY